MLALSVQAFPYANTFLIQRFSGLTLPSLCHCFFSMINILSGECNTLRQRLRDCYMECLKRSSEALCFKLTHLKLINKLCPVDCRATGSFLASVVTQKPR